LSEFLCIIIASVGWAVLFAASRRRDFMSILKLFKKRENLLGIDIGASSLKLVELQFSNGSPSLINYARVPLPADVFNSSILTKGDVVSDVLNHLLESNAIPERRVVTAMPSPSVFTKKVRMQKMGLEDLSTNIQFEASNFIPHNIDAVQLDYHVLGEVGKNQLDILVVAAKSEIINSYIDGIALTGLQTAIVDVDYFALQNAFEFCNPDEIEDTVALINIGNRYTSVNIVRNGESLFAGDISVATRQIQEALETALDLKSLEAAQVLTGEHSIPERQDEIDQVIAEQVDNFSNELNRQLSFFWNASGADDGIDKIYLSGGGAILSGMLEALSAKTGIESALLDCTKHLDYEDRFEQEYIDQLKPFMTICMGLALRQPGDKILPEGL